MTELLTAPVAAGPAAQEDDCAAGLDRRAFATGQEVRWCPGCGDYAILNQVQKVLPALGVPRENLVFVSGIGCSSRFPYYVNTYGIHGIHGRAPAIATGIKCANPELSVWVITGDGDGFSIGTNHLIHTMRRNVDLTVLLFNNRIYGLTKGQYSPTSEFGKKTKSSPLGTIEQPIRPVQMALAAEATFVARTVYADQAHLAQTIEAAARHRGTAFVEILQNCRVFNESAFEQIADRDGRDEGAVYLEHGQPIRFGHGGNRGIAVRNMEPRVVELAAGQPGDDLLVHDATATSPALAALLAALEPPDFPTALGIFRQVSRPTYDELLMSHVRESVARRGVGRLEELLNSGGVWEIA
ncbi:MAG: 2-oxoacid:ferredoxin oxidoreductase subunit beta [Candidatus Latescibacterota bacterium]|jgi:2-oxoglutarate ferredoxin oxidoreductase subunit beta